MQFMIEVLEQWINVTCISRTVVFGHALVIVSWIKVRHFTEFQLYRDNAGSI